MHISAVLVFIFYVVAILSWIYVKKISSGKVYLNLVISFVKEKFLIWWDQNFSHLFRVVVLILFKKVLLPQFNAYLCSFSYKVFRILFFLDSAIFFKMEV